jgi:peroxiredoxin
LDIKGLRNEEIQEKVYNHNLNGVLADKGADLISCDLVNDHDQIEAWAKEHAII